MIAYKTWVRMSPEAKHVHTNRFLDNKPGPAPFVGIPEYTGPHAGKVNMLIDCARRIAKGAVEDGLTGVCYIADEWRGGSK